MVSVGPIREDEREAWERLYLAYADFYQFPVSQEVLDIVWSWIFNSDGLFHCLVARNGRGNLIGLAHFKPILSPLRGKEIGFLDDLYVDPEYGGDGVVDALFSALRDVCVVKGWPFMRWHTRDNNYRARAVYDKYAMKTDWLTYQLDATKNT